MGVAEKEMSAKNGISSHLINDEFNVDCMMCNSIVNQYCEEKYNGMRGKCINCEINFPLE